MRRGESVGVDSEDWPGCSEGRSGCSERSGWLSSLGCCKGCLRLRMVGSDCSGS